MKHTKRFIIFITLLGFFGCTKPKNSSNQNVKIYNGNTDIVGFQVIKLTNGTYVAACHEDNITNTSLLYAADANGNKLWSVTERDSSPVNSIAATTDGGFVASAYSINKYNADGTRLWSSTAWFDSTKTGLIGQYIYTYPALCCAPGGTIMIYYILSGTDTNGNYHPAAYMAKMNEQGVFLGTSKMPFAGEDTLTYDIFKMIVVDNEIYAVGTQFCGDFINGLTFNYACFKANQDGALAWINCPHNPDALIYLPSNINYASAVEIEQGYGNTIIVGMDSSTSSNGLNYDAGHYCFGAVGAPVLETFDRTTGVVTKSVTLNFPKVNMHPYISSTSDGGYICVFTSGIKYGLISNNNNFFSNSNISLVKTDANLNQQWTSNINSPYPSRPFGVFQTPDGGYLIFAFEQSLGVSKSDLAVFKVNKTGNIVGN